eukprot:scaffold114308_cov63-Attheya_sp.AAC.2
MTSRLTRLRRTYSITSKSGVAFLPVKGGGRARRAGGKHKGHTRDCTDTLKYSSKYNVSHNTMYRDRGSSHQTHVAWCGLSLCGELGEERESTEQEALWCFYHQHHGSLHMDGCHGLWRRGEDNGDGGDDNT